MKEKIIQLIDKKLEVLESKITEANKTPLTGDIYNLEGWLTEAKSLIELKYEIEQIDKNN